MAGDSERFIVEILVDAKNRASEALKSVGLDVDRLQQNLKGAEKTVDSFDRHMSQLDTHVTKARETIRSLNPTLEALDRKFKSLGVSTVALDKGIDKAARSMEKLSPALAAATKVADSLEEKLNKLDAKMVELGARKADPKIEIDGLEKTNENIDALILRLVRLTRQRWNAKLGIEQQTIDSQIAEVEAKLHAFELTDVVKEVKLQVDREHYAELEDLNRRSTKSFEDSQKKQAAARQKTADDFVADVRRELNAQKDFDAEIAVEEEARRHESDQRRRDSAAAAAAQRRKDLESAKKDAYALSKAEHQAYKFDAARDEKIKIKVEAENVDKVKSEIAALNIEAKSLAQQDIGFRAVLNSNEFNRNYAEIRKKILELSGIRTTTNVGISKEEFMKDAAEVEAVATKLGLKRETIKIILDYDRSSFSRLEQSFNNFSKKTDKWASDFGDNFQITLRGLVNGALRLIVLFSEPLLSALTGVAGGLVAVGAAAGSAVAGLVGLASAAAAQAVPALGALAFAFSRVQAIVKTVGLAYKQQQQTGQQQLSLDQARAAAQDAIVSAQEGLVKAQQAVIDSTKALADARRAGIRTLTDLVLAEQSAVLASQRSQLALSSAIGTGSGSVVEAQLQARSDSISANRATVDNTRAQAGGINALPAVTAAQKQLEASVQGVTDAQRQLDAANRGAAAASERLIRSANAFNIAFDQLSAGEKKLYSVLHNKNNTGLLDLFQNNLESPIRKTTDVILGGVTKLAKGIRTLLLDPTIYKAFNNLAKSLAAVFDNVGKIGAGPFKSLRDALVFFIDEAARNMKPLSQIFGELLSIFISLAKAGSGPLREALDGISAFFGDLSKKAGSKSGQSFLSQFFEQGLKSLAAFLRLGGALINLFAALIGPGGGATEGVKGIDRLTESINKAAGYVEKNGAKFRKFFHDSIEVSSQVLKVFVALGAGIVKAFDPKSVKAFATFLTGFVFPALVVIVHAIGVVVKAFLGLTNSGPGKTLGQFLVILGLVTIGLAEMAGAVLGLVSKISGLFGLLAKVADSTLVLRVRLLAMAAAEKAAAAGAKIMEAAQWLLNTALAGARYARFIAELILLTAAQKVAAGAAKVMAAAQWLLNVAMDANPIALAVIAIVAIGAAFYLAYKKIKPFHEAVDAVFSYIKKHWVTIVEIMLGPLGLVIAGLRKFGPSILHAFKSAFHSVFDFIKGLPGTIASIFSDGIHAIGHVFESIGSRIVKAIIKGIKSAPKALFNALKDILPGPLKGAIGAIGSVVGLATGGRIGGDPSTGDSVHVRVRPGEVILNRDQQSAVGPDRINAALSGAPTIFSAGRGYATGGGRATGRGNAVDANASYSQALIALLDLTSVDTNKIADEFTSMRSHIRRTFKNINSDAKNSWGDFFTTTKKMLGKVSDVFTKTFTGTANVTHDAFKYIGDASDSALKQLGGKPVKLTLEKPNIASQPMATGGVAGFVGKAGERGRDAVHAVLGRGEAVLNYAHQRLVNPALQKMYGFGLGGMFQRVNAEHAGGAVGYAKGGFTGGANFFGHPSNVSPAINKLIGFMEQRFPELSVTSTTDHSVLSTSGLRSLHTDGMAVDMAGPAAYMNAVSNYIKSSGLYRKLTEGIHNPNLSVKNGQIVPASFWGPAVWAQHANHIHLGIRGALSDIKGAVSQLAGGVADKLKVNGPEGSLRSIVRRELNKVRHAADNKVGGTNHTASDASQSIRISDARGGTRVGATTFGGPHDPGTGTKGYRGDNLLQHPNSYAELSNPGTLDFSALGGLPYKQKLRVSAPSTGKSAVAYKRDVGKGGPAVNGVKRGIDLWWQLAEALGLGDVWSGVVKVQKLARGGLAKLGWGGMQADGGSYFVDKPTMFVAGENGPEHAQFTPMAGGFPGYPPLGTTPSAPNPLSATIGGGIPKPRQLASPHTYDAPKTTPKPVVVQPVVATPSPADTAAATSSAKSSATKATKKATNAFQKLYDDVFTEINKAIQGAKFSDTKIVRQSVYKVFGTFDKLSKKAGKALDVFSAGLDSLLNDQNSPIVKFQEAAAARLARIQLGTQKSRTRVAGRGRETRARSIGTQYQQDQRTVGDLGQARDDIKTEDEFYRRAEEAAKEGIKRTNADKSLSKSEKKTINQRFEGAIKNAQGKRAVTQKALADNADALLAAQDTAQRDVADGITTFFDGVRSIYDRIKRKLVARGKETAGDRAKGYDLQIDQANAEVEQLKKVNTKGNPKLAKEIADKIAELETSVEEIAAAKFQDAIDSINTDATKKLTFNDAKQKLAGLGVSVGQAAQFATSGTGINLAQLGSTDFGAQGAALNDRGQILRDQRAALAAKLAEATTAGNTDQMDKLGAAIQDLDGSIVDNAKAVRDNTDAALQAAADALRTPLDQKQSIGNAGLGLLKAMESLGINTTSDQKALLTGNSSIISGQISADKTSFSAAITDKGGAIDPVKLATLSGKALVDYIQSVVGNVQTSGLFNKDEIATITSLGASILTDSTALEDNTKALKDLSTSVTQSFNSSSWTRFRKAIFDGNGGLLPQYASHIPSFAGGGVMNSKGGLALLHPHESIFTPAQTKALGGVGGTDETHLHITSPIEKFDPVWASRQISFARRNRG